MAGIFSDPTKVSTPATIAPPPPPSPLSEDTAAARATQVELDRAALEQRNRARKGRASTILTGPQGVTNGEGTLASRTLLEA